MQYMCLIFTGFSSEAMRRSWLKVEHIYKLDFSRKHGIDVTAAVVPNIKIEDSQVEYRKEAPSLELKIIPHNALHVHSKL